MSKIIEIALIILSSGAHCKHNGNKVTEVGRTKEFSAYSDFNV